MSLFPFFVCPKSSISFEFLVFVQLLKGFFANGQICADFQACMKKCSISLYYGRLFSHFWQDAGCSLINLAQCHIILADKTPKTCLYNLEYLIHYWVCIRIQLKLIHSHLGICCFFVLSTWCKSIMLKPMNVIEFDKFFGDQLAIFHAKFVNFMFCQKCYISWFRFFSSKANFLCP